MDSHLFAQRIYRFFTRLDIYMVGAVKCTHKMDNLQVTKETRKIRPKKGRNVPCLMQSEPYKLIFLYGSFYIVEAAVCIAQALKPVEHFGIQW